MRRRGRIPRILRLDKFGAREHGQFWVCSILRVFRQMCFLVGKNCLNVRSGEPIGMEDSLLNGHVLCALKLAETPDAKIKRLFKIKRCLRIPDKSVIWPRFWRTRALRRLFRLFFRVASDNDMCSQDKDRGSFYFSIFLANRQQALANSEK